MITTEQSDHFFNSPEADEIADPRSRDDVTCSVCQFIERTAIEVLVRELVEDYMHRV